MVLLFKDSISGTAEAKVSDSDTSCKCMHESKAQTQYTDHAQTMARTSNKISVPQERGRFAIGDAAYRFILNQDGIAAQTQHEPCGFATRHKITPFSDHAVFIPQPRVACACSAQSDMAQQSGCGS